jgi:glycosyltransferase involved in cell wall biosynthesis
VDEGLESTTAERPEERYTFTVFTPTYNRAHTLPRTYESLEAQTFKDFEWLVIDDGSTDDTESVVREWLRGSSFPIRYIRQANVGKHISTNRAADLAAGELMGTLDSDDWYAPNALERFLFHWESIPEERRDEFVGVVGLCADRTGAMIGVRFPQPVMDSDYFEMQFVLGAVGDKAGVGRTEINRRFRFPELEPGGYVPESIVYNRMARHYKARLVNEVLMFKEHQPGGVSPSAGIARAQAPRTSRLYYQELIERRSSLPRTFVFRHHANHTRFALHAGDGLRGSRSGAASVAWWATTLPVGVALYLRDRLVLRRLASRSPK